MSEVNVQIQNPQQTVNINNPSIVIEIPTDSIEVEITEQTLEIQVQSPVIEVNIGGPCDCSGGGHTIEDEGTPLTQRDTLNFTGAGVTVTDAGGKTVVTIPGGGGSPDWGDIGGTLSDQTDLQTALDGKAETSHTHTFADIESGVLPDLSSSATVQPDGAFAVKYDGGNDAIQVLDEDGSVEVQAKSGGATISVSAEGAAIIGDPFVSIESDASTGDAGQVLTAVGDGTATWQDAAGGGGSVEIIDITYADMETTLTGSTLTPGQFYRITDAAGTDLGFICQAIRENEITVNGQGGYLNADFQAVGDYSNAVIPAVPFYIYYAGASGAFTVGETITGDDQGSTAVVVSDDESGTLEVSDVTGDWNAEIVFSGDMSGNTAAINGYDEGGPEITGTQKGIWRTGFEAVTIAYTNLSGGTFAVGDTITGGNTGATAVIVTDNGASSMEAYMTSAGVAFDGSEQLDNGNGVTADMDGAAGSPTIVLGDVVIWNLLHYQLTDDTLLDGTNPETNTAAYTLLDKATYPETYVEAWDISEYSFSSDEIIYRQDSRGNLVRGATGISGFQWGRDECSGNNIQSPDAFDIINLIATFATNTTYPGANLSEISTGNGATIENNIIENGGALTGITAGANCSISRNKIGQGATIGGEITMGDGSQMDDHNMQSASVISDVEIVSGAMAGMSLGLAAEIKRIYIDGGNMYACTLGPDVQLTDLTLNNNTQFGDNRIVSTLRNKTLDSDITITDCSFEIFSEESKTFSTSLSTKLCQSGLSVFPEVIDITGASALDITTGNEIFGIFYLTSSNTTETIAADSLSNFPTLFPFRLSPASGLTLTLTGTAAASATNGSIVMSGATIVLDGTNGDWVELEADSTGTFVRVKNVQIYA